jgi:hypothetical protein
MQYTIFFIYFCQNTDNAIKPSITIKKKTNRTHAYSRIHMKLKTIRIIST